MGGADAESFAIDESSGQLRTKAALDYEMRTVYTVDVTVTDLFDANATITVTIMVTEVTTGSALGDRYDVNGNGVIDREEVDAAIADYHAGLLTREEVITIINLYFSGASSDRNGTGPNEAARASETGMTVQSEKAGPHLEAGVVKRRKW